MVLLTSFVVAAALPTRPHDPRKVDRRERERAGCVVRVRARGEGRVVRPRAGVLARLPAGRTTKRARMTPFAPGC